MHCLTDFFPQEGLAQAEQLDKHFQETGKVVGPLHGVPISVKDFMALKGHYASAGFWSTRAMCDKDCELVEILRSLGAVFFVKTSAVEVRYTASELADEYW